MHVDTREATSALPKRGCVVHVMLHKSSAYFIVRNLSLLWSGNSSDLQHFYAYWRHFTWSFWKTLRCCEFLITIITYQEHLLQCKLVDLLYNTGNQSLLHFTLLQRKTHMSGAWSQKQAHIKRKTTLINCSYIDIMGYWNNLCCDLSP